jgi:tetratricopeptide (TPR) repeat protein
MHMIPLVVLSLLAADPNAEGFALYKKGDFVKAHELFKKAVAAAPKNPWARVNHARTLAVLSKGEAPADYCTYEKNWIHLALAELDKAVELDRKAVLAKLAEPDPGIKLLEKLTEYQLWLAAVRFEATSDAALTKFLEANPSWHQGGAGRIPVSLTLEPKTWSVKDKRVSITREGRAARYTVAVRGWFFGEGKFSFRVLLLENVDDAGDAWTLGPVVADCD